MVRDTHIIYKEDALYPALLRGIPDAPARLYYKGTWAEELFTDCLAVVGSRHMTSYGRRVTEQLVGEVASRGVTIVSGFMYGIDVAAHKAALGAGGKTIAIMPCGIERIHPEYQEDIYWRILETGGLVLSEYEGDSMPAYWTYPKRNRIVAGLSKATLVVEAGLKSGSLITAELTRMFGRKLFAVPGPITSEVSKGTTKLLKEGATLVASSDDILEHYGKKRASGQASGRASGKNDLEQKILDALQQEPFEVDLLARTLGMAASTLGTTLSLLELQGIIKHEGGKYYVD
ncbi:MAG: DNA-protecting protein DprA [Candidatus Wildermuthbacteria bacterium]|nr:DNA-protecting protein DprA [Candidatus Wildermuthbacteria bacterium]